MKFGMVELRVQLWQSAAYGSELISRSAIVLVDWILLEMDYCGGCRVLVHWRLGWRRRRGGIEAVCR